MDSPDCSTPESMSEAAGRAAAALTTRLIQVTRETGLPLDPVTLQSTLTLAFEQGANWGCERSMQISSSNLPAANRRAL